MNLTAGTYKIDNRTLPWQIKWNSLRSLPQLSNKENKGVAAVFSGFVGSELIIAGGTNFLDKMPWEGGKKNWERVLYCVDIDSGEFQWKMIPDFLPVSVAYGVSIQLEQGVLCIGGCDADRCFDEVFFIYKENGMFRLSNDWPSLPVPLANATGALLDNKIYIAGGQEEMIEENATNHFFVLDLDNKDKGWTVLPAWDGSARGYAVGVAINKGKNAGFYLFSGRDYRSSGYVEILTDGHMFDPVLNSWTQLQGTFSVMGGTAFAQTGDVVFLGGVTKLLPGSYHHPGFDNILRVYDPVAGVFVYEEILSFPVPVTTNIAKWKNNFYITSGEIKPGMRTPSIYRGRILPVRK